MIDHIDQDVNGADLDDDDADEVKVDNDDSVNGYQ